MEKSVKIKWQKSEMTRQAEINAETSTSGVTIQTGTWIAEYNDAQHDMTMSLFNSSI